MRIVLCSMSLLASSWILVGCGQSGALQLPSDPNFDKRARYMLYPNPVSKSQTEQAQATQADAQQAVSATTESK